MTIAVISDIATMLFCSAVLVQTVRLMRCLQVIRGGELTGVVKALDTSTMEARRVVGRLGELLNRDVATTARSLDEGKSMIEELTIMTGIANAIAERIVDASGPGGDGVQQHDGASA